MAAVCVQDIVAGTFKGFAMLRSFANQVSKAPEPMGFLAQPVPVYIEGYGFVPPSQVCPLHAWNYFLASSRTRLPVALPTSQQLPEQCLKAVAKSANRLLSC